MPGPTTNSESLPTLAQSNTTIASPGMPPMPAAPWMDSAEKKEGFDLGSLLHSLRRRWLVGLGLGFLSASLVAGLLFLLVPEKHQAFVLIRVRRAEGGGLSNRQTRYVSTQEFELFKKTQADLMKSSFVITAALRRPGISQLPLVRYKPWGRERDDPVAWLERSVQIKSPEGTEIVVMSMRDRYGDQIIKVLNAMTDAYLDEVVTAEQLRQTAKLEKLRVRERRTRDEMRDMLQRIKTIAEDFGSTESEQNKLKIDLAFKRLGSLEQDKLALEREMRELQTEYFLLEQEMFSARGRQIDDWQIESVLMSVDLEYGALVQELTELKLRQSGNTSGIGGLGQRISEIQQKLDQIKYAKKKEVIKRMQMDAGRDPRDIQDRLTQIKSQIQFTQNNLANLAKQYQDQVQLISKMGKSNADMQLLQIELESLEKISNTLSEERESLELEMDQQKQIQVLQRAHIPAGSSLIFRVVQVFAAWLVTLMVTVFGVALLDFSSKRVNTSKDVMERGEVRVIGTLPLLSGRRAGGLLPMSDDMRKSVEIGLARSIDSIRTALLFSKAKKQTEVVLVTSSLGQEGKTTVASQLAVSMARSGRRTLLIDGDIRNPQLHVVLGMPFQAGLCELLREEASLEDVVHATPAEGLWHLCAGFRDPQTDQFLASPALGKLIEEFRSRFDMIVIDTGPVLTCPDAMLIGQHSDVAIISVRRDISRLPKVTEAAERLRTVGVEIAGAVVNGMAPDVRSSELRAPVAQSTDPQLENVG